MKRKSNGKNSPMIFTFQSGYIPIHTPMTCRLPSSFFTFQSGYIPISIHPKSDPS